MTAIVKAEPNNYLLFGKTRIDLDARAEHAIMGALEHRQSRTFECASGHVYDLRHIEGDVFCISTLDGPTFATINGDDLVAILRDLRAIILGDFL
jgi:hypothetical protein